MDGNREDLPRLVVGVIARRIRMQLDNCDMSGKIGTPVYFGQVLP